MCRAKPGRRCGVYTRAHLSTMIGREGKARRELDEARGTPREGSAQDQLDAARRDLVLATILNDATEENRRFLADRFEQLEPDDPGRPVIAHRLLVASMYVEERSAAVALMPDQKPVSKEGAAAYEELGLQRERLTLLHSQATVSGDEEWAELARRQEQVVYDAEVAYRIAEAGGKPDPEQHEPGENPTDAESVKESHQRATEATGAHPERVARKKSRSTSRPKLRTLRRVQKMRRTVGQQLGAMKKLKQSVKTSAQPVVNDLNDVPAGESILDFTPILPGEV